MWRRQLSIGRLKAARIAPYLASALAAMRPVEAPALGTFGVDRHWRLYVDPEMFDRWSLDEIAGVLLHEAGHLLRDHAGRRPPHVDPRAWNVCGDLEINDDLAASDGVELPSPLLPSSLGLPDGLTAEQYLERLVDLADGLPACNCGSGADGETREQELPSDGAEGPPPVTPFEADLIRRRTAKAIRAAGTATGAWRSWADAQLDAVVPWTRLLARIAGRTGDAVRTGGSDHSFRRPSRRTQPGGPTLPSLHGREPIVALVVDTSGSMTDEDMAEAITEARGAVRAAGRINLVWCDTEATVVRDVRRVETAEIPGGGGTDLIVGIRAAAELGADLTVVLTDGHAPWPPSPPTNGVVVLIGDDPADDPEGWTVLRRP